jgi:hypothetical protein
VAGREGVAPDQQLTTHLSYDVLEAACSGDAPARQMSVPMQEVGVVEKSLEDGLGDESSQADSMDTT